MPALATLLRRDLERTIVQARKTAETGAANSLIALGYADPAKRTGMSDEDAALRTALRARGRQLGEAQGEEGVTNGRRGLVEEIAYEQWHRMLFARFLAENGLLRHSEGATVTLDDCAELADEEGARDAWDLAARYAAAMLPGLFRASDPAVRVRLARESYAALEGLVAGLPIDVFTSDDGLGWVYQFWQSERKKQVNAEAKSRGTKLGGAELPAVTQLFTEPYMVDFLLQNTLGAWWAGKYPDSPLLAEMPYLRFEDPTPQPPPHLDFALRDSSDGEGEQRSASGGADHGARQRDQHEAPLHPHPQMRDGEGLGWGHARRPAAGTYDGWAKTVAELKVLDPCCGSGHFLVAAFGWLRRMRMAEEGLSEADAANAVLRDNLFGLELDRRCTQIAMFNVALAAWRVGGHPERHVPQVACSGTPVKGQLKEWQAIAGKDEAVNDLLERLHKQMEDAPTLGSLVDPRQSLSAEQMRIWEVDYLRNQVLQTLRQIGQSFSVTDDLALFASSAQDAAIAAELEAKQYDLVVTNVPYLSRSSHSSTLRTYVADRESNAGADLATIFLERCMRFGLEGHTVATVTPQNWLTQAQYRQFREDALVSKSIQYLVRLGPGAFQSIGGEVVNVILIVISNSATHQASTYGEIDAHAAKSVEERSILLQSLPGYRVSQSLQQLNIDSKILSKLNPSDQVLLEGVAKGYEGTSSGDGERYEQQFWESRKDSSIWSYFQTAPETAQDGSGRGLVVRWERGGGSLSKSRAARVQGQSAWNRTGVLVGKIGTVRVATYGGTLFDKNCVAIIPTEAGYLPAIYTFCRSIDYLGSLRSIDSGLAVATASITQVPFDLDYWQTVAAEKYPDGLPEPHSDDPTQWLFTDHPKGSEAPLHVALARLLGYRWPEQPDGDDGLDGLADPDSIVCLPPVAGEQPAADRLRALLAAAFGADWSPDTLDGLLHEAGSKAPVSDLATWLREDAFRQHTALFHNRPFLWHIWDGRKDGFAAIVNYHRLDGARLNKLIYTYLGDWISRQREDDRADVPGARARLDAALDLYERLKLISAGEAPHDIYVRWKSLAQQPIGWEPDLNDGVRLNIRPFIEAGVLRSKFTVKWGKDRGANPAGADVYRWSEAAQRAAENTPEEIDGALRLNDLHLSLATKRAARQQAQAEPEQTTAGGQRPLV